MSRNTESFGAKRSLALLWAIFSVPLLIGAIFLLLVSVTFGGRSFALGTVALILAPTLWVFAPRSFGVFAVAAGLASWLVCAWLAPSRSDAGGEGDAAFIVYDNGTKHSRFSPATLVPEVDQQVLGTYLFGVLDPSISFAQSKRLRQDILDIYGEFMADERTGELPSVMGFAYQDLFLGRRPHGNKFVYVPESDQSQALPVVVFLHGSLGNFKAYWQILRSLADTAEVAIVAPTFGAGNWYMEGGMESVEDAMTWCRNDSRIDGERIILAGLSNGGTGVTRAAAKFAADFKSLILLSPIVETSITETQAFREGWRGRRVFILSGTGDKRVPVEHLRAAEQGMSDAGVEVNSNYIEDADHFMFFAHREDILKILASELRLVLSGKGAR